MDYHQLFSRLNEKLSEENLQLHLHCVGGFVLEYYGMKATEDIDAFYESTEKVEKIIPPSAYTHLRWMMKEPLDAGQVQNFAYRSIVK